MELVVQWGIPGAVAALAMTILGVRAALGYLRRRQIMDLPNERSSHTLPTPRGGGLATTPVLAALMLAQTWPLPLLAGGALVLFAISWIDDRRGLPALPRFSAHAVVVAVTLALMPAEISAFAGALPLWADRMLCGLGWLWFVNLYNFMDGIDGITGIETLCIGIGIALLAPSLAPAALIAAAVALGFLFFNWHPAKLFLGDAGSVPFGYVLGGLLLVLAAQGQLAAALILPGYYLADATITISRRALRGEKVWQAHRSHFYQRAIQGGKRHDQVGLAIATANVALIGCAWVSRDHLIAAVATACITIAVLLWRLNSWGQGKRT